LRPAAQGNNLTPKAKIGRCRLPIHTIVMSNRTAKNPRRLGAVVSPFIILGGKRSQVDIYYFDFFK
jgi:hypothetical protein